MEITKEEEACTSNVAKEIKGLREQLEKNQKLAQAIKEEPNRVIIKSYLQGQPTDLNNICSSMFNSLRSKKTGEESKRYGLTIMVEELN